MFGNERQLIFVDQSTVVYHQHREIIFFLFIHESGVQALDEIDGCPMALY